MQVTTKWPGVSLPVYYCIQCVAHIPITPALLIRVLTINSLIPIMLPNNPKGVGIIPAWDGQHHLVRVFLYYSMCCPHVI